MSDTTQPSGKARTALSRFKPGSITELFMRSITGHGLFIGLTMLYYGLFLAFVRPHLPPADKGAGIVLLGLVASVALSAAINLFLLRFYHMARHEKPKHPILGLIKNYWRFITNRVNLAHGLPILVLMVPFGYLYVTIKKHITVLQPFSWDKAFYELDKWVHFGVDPWQIIHPVMSLHPRLVNLLNFNYNIWFFVMWMVLIAFAFSTTHTKIRARFLVTFFLTWSVGGSVLAIVFSSAGPAFYADLGLGPDPYAELMAHLNAVREQVPVWALDLQENMWKAHKGNGVDVGISAMPSMHNASALLFVLATWNVNRKIAWILAAHCFLVYIGSIYLAWHYAIDAWLSWAIVVAFWWGSKPLVNWWHARPEWLAYEATLQQNTQDRP